MAINFNDISKDDPSKDQGNTRRGEDAMEKAIRTGERTRFIAKPNPMVERAFQVFEYNFTDGKYEHSGDYTLINKDEPRELTDKKVQNLMTLLNGKDEMIDVSNLTKARVLFTLIPEAQAGDQTKMVFKDHDGSGVSKDNAVFTIRKGVFK